MGETVALRVLAAAVLAGSAVAANAQIQRPASGPRTALIVGQVVDGASGRPVGGAIVSIGGAGAAPRILTRPDGRYLFRDLPAGTFTITAAKGGYAEGAFGRRRPGGPAQSLVLEADQRIGDAVVRIWKLAAISGTIADENGEPAVRAQVRAWRRTWVAGHAMLVYAATAFTDDRGIYRFGALMPGDYIVGASARHVTRLVNAAPEGSGAQALQVGNFLYSLTGGVVTPPPPGERLSVYPSLFYPGERDVSHAGVVGLGSGEERIGIDVRVHPTPTARVSGMLLAPDGPAGPMTVRLVPDGRAGMSMDADAPSTTSEASGAFVFFAVPAGTYTLRASTTVRQPGMATPPELGWAAVPLEVGTDDIDGLAVQLMPGLRIGGSVEFDGTSTPPSERQLRRIPLLIEPALGDGELGTVPRVSVDERGEFSTPPLIEGAYVLRVTDSPPGWMFHSATYNGRDISSSSIDLVGSDATGVVIRFTDRWSSIAGSVQSPSRNPDPDALVIMFPTERRLWTGYGTGTRSVRAVRTARSGGYNLGPVIPGEYLLVAVPDDRASDWQDPEFLGQMSSMATRVIVADGEHKRQELRTRGVR